jgi:hypothetical protein
MKQPAPCGNPAPILRIKSTLQRLRKTVSVPLAERCGWPYSQRSVSAEPRGSQGSGDTEKYLGVFHLLGERSVPALERTSPLTGASCRAWALADVVCRWGITASRVAQTNQPSWNGWR